MSHRIVWRQPDILDKLIALIFRIERLTDSSYFLLGIHFKPEDGGSMFLRNVRISPDYTTL
jgi:hypothetical protein